MLTAKLYCLHQAGLLGSMLRRKREVNEGVNKGEETGWKDEATGINFKES